MNRNRDNWTDFFEKTDNRDIVIWGSGKIALEVVWLVEMRRTITHIVDSDLNKIGKVFGKYVIESPDTIFKHENNFVVLICSQYITDISRELKRYGIVDYYSALFMQWPSMASDIVTKLPKEEQLTKLKSIMSDDRSVQILESIISKRMNGEIDYSDIMTKTQYLVDEIFSFSEKEIYVDAGAFDGDTVMDFIQKVQIFNKIYAFEADFANFQKMNMKLELAKQIYRNKIECLNLAVTDYDGTANFIPLENQSSKVCQINDKRTVKVGCTMLDIIAQDATYIKMDIEGSELSALKGAQNIIKCNKPKMAICIYHRPEDLWEIPLFIHSLVPDYKFYIRHHTNVYYDTVLYVSI